MTVTAKQAQRFFAYAADEGRGHAHRIPGAASLQDAALQFAEHWAASNEDIRVVAFDGDTGEQHCFCVTLDAGEVQPCV